jgi:hypothetical protein
MNPIQKLKGKKGARRVKGVVSRYSTTLPAIKTKLFTEPTEETLAAAAYKGYGFGPTLANFNNYGTFCGVFEQYRVLGLTIHFIFPNTQISSSAIVSYMTIAPDFDETTAPASTVAGMLNVIMKAGHRQFHTNGIHTFKIEPRMHIDVAADSAFTTDSMASHWITTIDTDVVMYGAKAVVKSLNPTGNYLFDYYYELDIEFRGQHAAVPGVAAAPTPVQVLPEFDKVSSEEVSLLTRLAERCHMKILPN